MTGIPTMFLTSRYFSTLSYVKGGQTPSMFTKYNTK
jgi:hypothetical protein